MDVDAALHAWHDRRDQAREHMIQALIDMLNAEQTIDRLLDRKADQLHKQPTP